MLIIVAGLSIQDPRERPADKQAQADQQHARFKVDGSDFAGYLTLWDHLTTQQNQLSRSAFRRMCQREFLHYLRVREWQDLHQQLRSIAGRHRLDPARATSSGGQGPDLDRVHQAVLSGLLSHVGLRDAVTRDYLGARGARFAISPGSQLFRKQPTYVMAAELVETTRLWARVNARIDPLWAERLGADLVSRSYSEPRWSRRQGSVVATERVTLFGVTLAADRTVQYGRIDPDLSRELFIRHALVEGDWETRHAFVQANADVRRRIEGLEEKTRRRDLIVDDEDLFAFFDARIPPDIVSAAHFDRWWRSEQVRAPRLLTLTEEDLRRSDGTTVLATDFPGSWRQGDLDLRVTYRFDPGSVADGVTVHIPVTVLNQVRDVGFDWQVPGLRADLVAGLIRSLPKATRRHFVPAPDHAAAVLRVLRERPGPIVDELTRVLKEQTGIGVGPDEWDVAKVPAHLRVTFSIEDSRGQVLALGKDLEALRLGVAGQVQQRISSAGAAIERGGLTSWSIGEIPATFRTRSGGHEIIGHPALVDAGTSVSLRVLPTPEAAAAAHRLGLRRLLLLQTSPPWKRVLAGLSNRDKLALGRSRHGSVPALLQDALAAAVDGVVADLGIGEIRDAAAFDQALTAVRTHAAARVLGAVAHVVPILERSRAIEDRLATLSTPLLAATVADVRAQLDGLVGPGFIAATGLSQIAHVPRYLRAVDQRLDKAVADPGRDRRLLETIDPVEAAYADLLAALPPHTRVTPQVRDIAWMIEELRVGVFAQALGTAYPVSAKRVLRAIADLPR